MPSPVIPPAILLANLGTPDAPTAPALRRYLAAFLGDPRVIEYPRWFWLPLLHGIILQTRPPKSAKLYQSIWTEDGSPLRVTSMRLAEKLETALKDRTWPEPPVYVGMRYGSPNITDALRQMRDDGHDRVLTIPLFPQYSATTTASIFDAVLGEVGSWRNMPAIRTVRNYATHPLYISALANSLRAVWDKDGRPERLLMSFHGIPQSYADRGDPYPSECEATAQALAGLLGLSGDQWAMSYQSKFGPGAWLTPATDDTLIRWADDGLKRVDVICPGFSVDSLETIEEINEENRDYFLEHGGEQFRYVSALNDSDMHVSLMLHIALQHLAGWV